MHTSTLEPEPSLPLIFFLRSLALGYNLFPFYLAKVLHRIPKIETQAASSNESDNNEPLPLDPSLIPSSPIDVSTFQVARNTLSQHMATDPAFKTPVRNFVDRLAKSSERIWARHAILEPVIQR